MALASVIFAGNGNFIPDARFQGSDLAGWQALGDTGWRAQDGEIIATPKQEGGGWLFLSQGYQDIEFAASFRCTASCKVGLLLRAAKTAEGVKGVFVSLLDGAAYDVALNSQGQEVRRSALRPGPGPMIRMAAARFSGQEDLVPGFAKLAPAGGLPPASAPPNPRLHRRIGQRAAAGVAELRGTRMNGRRFRLSSTPMFSMCRSTTGAAGEPWTFYEANFGSGGAEMSVYDVNGDGLNDVVTALAAHGWGLAWFEQKRDRQGNISFVRHDIMGDYSTKNAGNVTFSELHGATFADLDGDGIPDLIVGKRHWSHLESYTDPDPYGPAVLYWYRTVRNPKADGGAEFVPELIHNRSGVGSHLAAVDLNHDGTIDIITSTNRGTFIFWNTMRPGALRPQGRRPGLPLR